MPAHTDVPRLLDIIEAIERIKSIIMGPSSVAFETDWQKRWMVERGFEIISEASRHLSSDIKDRNPDIPWRKVAGIGNVLRHDYESVSAQILWASATNDLPDLERVCRIELNGTPS